MAGDAVEGLSRLCPSILMGGLQKNIEQSVRKHIQARIWISMKTAKLIFVLFVRTLQILRQM